MKKVKVTQEQASEIERRKDFFTNEQTIKLHIKGWDFIECLNELSLDQMIKALYIGYEVEETFKKGDWVKVNWRSDEPSIHKVVKDSDGCRVKIDGNQYNITPGLRIVEHATPEEIAEEKERRFFAKHDRAVWELWDKDLLKHIDSELIFEVQFVSDDGVYLNHDSEARSWDLIKRNYLVACFYSDRKDVDNE